MTKNEAETLNSSSIETLETEIVQDSVDLYMNLESWPHTQTQEDDEIEDSQSSSETYMIGSVIVEIVGIQDYSGTISGGEMVGLVREPSNPDDQNAIEVLNTRAVQVGYIEQSAAKVLAPLIDNNLISSLQGSVLKWPGRCNGSKIPVRIHISGHPEAFAKVKSEISGGGLQLISRNDVFFTLPKAGVVKKRNAGKKGRTLDEIFKLVYENVSKKLAMEALEPPKDVIQSELLLHQKEGLGWLIHRENSCELPPFWEEKNGVYVNELTNCQTNERPETIRGGIFADDTGLGKTLTLLSLIAFDKCGCDVPSSIDSGRVRTEQSEAMDEDDKLVALDSQKAKRGRVGENDSNSWKKRKTEDTHFDQRAKGKSVGQSDKDTDGSGLKQTLIVCSRPLISTWAAQLAEHTILGRLNPCFYVGKRTEDAEVLQKYDIVVTTYDIFSSEKPGQETLMKNIEWWRVILDEAHMIRDVKTKRSIGVTCLNAKRRWVVTRTPIQNGPLDLFSLIVFLRFEPFATESYWDSLVKRPLAEGIEEVLLRLQVLVASISLRRRKDEASIAFPSKTIETFFVELSAEQRALYDKMENEAKSAVSKYIQADSVPINYSIVLLIILRLRQICTDLALCPSDLISCLPSKNIEDVSKNPEWLRKMVSFLQAGEDLDCPICISPPRDIVITICAHIFCRSCILRTLKWNESGCPLCHHHSLESDLFSSPPESFDTDNFKVSSSSKSSKVTALVELLSASRFQNPTTKSVVFSQFPKMLILLEERLKAAGFKILRLDGSVNPIRRAPVIQKFGLAAPDGSTVLLVSLKASGAVINLTAASTVYFLEPWLNPAVEDQAMGRVHRLGQKEDVKIVRMIAQNSIEERILELQEKRRKLAREAFSRKDRKGRRKMIVNDIRILLSL